MAGNTPVIPRIFSELPESWAIVPFPEAVFFQEGPGIRNWQYRDSGVPFVNIRCLVNGRLDIGSMNCLDPDEVEQKYRHFLLDPGDYVVSSSGTIGRIAEVRASDLPCMLNTSVIRMRPNTPQLDRGYLRYFLTSALFQQQIVAFAAGSVQVNYGPSHLRQMWIALPPLPEQRAIAHILGTLDDKIELNRQLNHTLEAIARAIFKSWFVDFDPVWANMEGRPYPLDPDTLALFPDTFEDSELGEVPAGWRVTKLDEVVEFAYGKSLPERARRPGEFPVFGSNGQVGWHDTRLVDGPGIIVGRKGNPGTVQWSSQAFFPIDTTFYVIPKGPVASLYYLFHALIKQDLPRLSSDSAVPGLNRNIAGMNTFLVPPAPVVGRFEEHVKSLYDLTDTNREMNRTLADLRDTLLPKLISGELRVPAAAGIVEEIAS